MPGAPFHDRQAQRNEEFFYSIDRAEFPDWATTALFHAAVHLYRAYAADVYGHTEHEDHGETAAEMEADPLMPTHVRSAYNDLKYLSWAARYYKWESISGITNVEGETLPLYEVFKAWVAAQRPE
jgi:hypothetical protein